LKASVQQLGLSARAHDKVLRLARTVADVEGAERLAATHVQEAINYRMLDRQL
jgi:magnesium chelatase family protein